MRKLLVMVVVAVGMMVVAAFGQNAGVVWTEVKSSPFGGSGVKSIVFGKDKFVAVGDEGKMAYSLDGVTWTAIKNSAFNKTDGIYRVVWGKDKFIAVGGYDDYSELYRKNEECRDRSVISKVGKFIEGCDRSGISSRGKMAYSSDGITWTPVKNDKIFKESYFTNIVWGKDKFVAIATTSHYDDGIPWQKGEIAHSSDGITWTIIKNSQSYDEVLWGGNKFIAFRSIPEHILSEGLTGALAYSLDGITWTEVKNSILESYPAVIAWGNNKFVAVVSRRFDDSVIMEWHSFQNPAYSLDGITWTVVSNHRLDENCYYSYFTYVKDIFVASVSDGGTSKIVYSSDGITWTTIKNYPLGSATAIAYGNGVFVAGSGGRLAYSK